MSELHGSAALLCAARHHRLPAAAVHCRRQAGSPRDAVPLCPAATSSRTQLLHAGQLPSRPVGRLDRRRLPGVCAGTGGIGPPDVHHLAAPQGKIPTQLQAVRRDLLAAAHAPTTLQLTRAPPATNSCPPCSCAGSQGGAGAASRGCGTLARRRHWGRRHQRRSGQGGFNAGQQGCRVPSP